jgi:GNAT superfamily N-acetyltransferase
MLNLRLATACDAQIVYQMILDLAEFQKHAREVRTTVANLRQQLSQSNPPFECLIAEVEKKPVGLALFYNFYSTWLGSHGLYLEDLFVYPQGRGQGIGRSLLSRLSEIAQARGCHRVEWMVQNDNRSAQNFYSNFGAQQLNEWSRWRFEIPA